jgi:hypothetical protein
MSKVDHEKKILVTANDFGSTKSNSSQSPKHHFCYECARACCINSSHLILSSTVSLCKARARTHAHPPTATAFVATAPRVALIFVASKKYDQTDSRAPKCLPRVTKTVMYIVRLTCDLTIIKSAWGALDQYRHTTLWVVGSSLVGAPKMLLWKLIGLGMIVFSRNAWLHR